MAVARAHIPVGPTDTGGSWTDTGPPIYGAIRQIFWHPNDPGDTGTAFDTGGDLKIDLLVGKGIDTGANLTVLNDNDCLGLAFNKVPTQPQVGSDGAADPSDTGAAFGLPIYAAGEPFRVTVTPGGRRVVGNPWIVTED